MNSQWTLVEDNTATIGITDGAQEEIGEIVYIELPKVGKKLKKDDLLAILESTKAAIDFYSPVEGTVIAVNETLNDKPELLNRSPEQEGWICKVDLA